ncbi:hypothetical protein [Phaeacidiphilus oryzae]|uniref:hypothetical protein n=1 Tax=Phaeacidiphilus oryzae TaxID=348818 RepID=UPI00055A246B|nr:hypothetical protein [Phaeacidiphilus oryzae]
MNDSIKPPWILVTRPELLAALRVSEYWLRTREEDDPEWRSTVEVDIANPGSSRQNLRYELNAVARHLGIPVPEVPIAEAA